MEDEIASESGQQDKVSQKYVYFIVILRCVPVTVKRERGSNQSYCSRARIQKVEATYGRDFRRFCELRPLVPLLLKLGVVDSTSVLSIARPFFTFPSSRTAHVDENQARDSQGEGMLAELRASRALSTEACCVLPLRLVGEKFPCSFLPPPLVDSKALR